MDKKRTNCPNCGAPIRHYYNYCCEYCGTFLNNTNEEIKNFKNCEVHDVKVDIEFLPSIDSIGIRITGKTTPKMYYLEECDLNSLIVSSEGIGKKIGFIIEIPYREYMNYTYENLDRKIYESLPDPFQVYFGEIMHQIYQIIEKKHLYFRGGR